MSLFGVVNFAIPREEEQTIDERTRVLHERYNVSTEKLTMDLLYDRQWCREQGIRYYDLETFIEGITAKQIAYNFVLRSIFALPSYKN